MRLDIYLDLGNIAGYLALEPVKQLIEQTGVDYRYLPIAGIVPRPISREPSTRDDDALSRYKHLRWQAKSRFEREELARDCKRLDLEVGPATRQFDAKVFHAACLYVASLTSVEPAARDVENAAELITAKFIEVCYELNFRASASTLDHPDEHQAVVKQAFLKCGIDGEDFFDKESFWLDQFEQHMLRTLETGIHDSPSFILSEETFQGRQNLPLIRWRIEAEVGLPPV